MIFISNIKLYHIDLRQNFLKNDGTITLIDGILNAKNSDLKVLRLDYNQIEKEAVMKISHNL